MARKTAAPSAPADARYLDLAARIREEPVSAALTYYYAMNLGGGLRGLVQEILRNAIYHGGAENVRVDVSSDVRGRPTLMFLDDGVGMDEVARLCWLSGIGYSQARGTGSGRLTALTLCQIIEVVTVPEREPDTAYRAVVHLPAFVIGTARRTWTPNWERVPRERTAFPRELAHGTSLTYRDFRASDPHAPEDEALMRDVSKMIQLEDIRTFVPFVLPPDDARRVIVGGTRIAVPDLEGYFLWRMAPKAHGSLGIVSGELRLAEAADGIWCTIGGTTASVPIPNFLRQFREHAPVIASRIPPELGERRLVGFIRIAALEAYPTQSREYLNPTFYTSVCGAETVEFLASVIGPVLRAKRAEYESRPASEATRASLARIVARVHATHGVVPGTVADGGDTPVGDPAAAVLQVNRVAYTLEAAPPDDSPADEAVFRITNPLPDETFTWNDDGKRLIVERGERGTSARVRAVPRVGRYAMDVRSDQHAHRQRTVSVDIRAAAPAAHPDEFRLLPMWTTVVAGDEKRFAVRSQGLTSGTYRWAISRVEGGSEHPVPDAAYAVSEDTRQCTFRPPVRGDYLVRCTDAVHPAHVATAKVEVFAKPADSPHPPQPTAGTGGDGYGGSGVRPTAVSRDGLRLEYGGRTYEILSVPYLHAPWALEAANARIVFSDSHPANSGARTPEERDRHLVWCLASAITAHAVLSGQIAAGDVTGISALQDDVLRSVFSSGSGAASAEPGRAQPVRQTRATVVRPRTARP